MRGGWKPESFPPDYLDAWRAQFGEGNDPKVWSHPLRDLVAIVTREHWKGDPEGELRWHISLRSSADGGRVPNWDEIVTAAHELRPGVPFVMGVPPRSWWMNLHPDVLHLWEPRDDAMIEQWRQNALGQVPT